MMRGCVAGLVLTAGLLGGCGPTAFLITPVPASRELREIELDRESLFASRKIALIEVDGVISNQRPSSLLGTEGDNPVSVLREKLDKAAVDRIHSPGGGATASDLMYTEVRRFREETGKPVIAYLLDVAASGGYYVACAADRILAHPSAVTGSIGVIMITPDLSGTMLKLGVRANVIKSGELKDAGSPFREMNPADRAIFEGIINGMYERFLAVVGEARRDLPAQRVRELADGRVYLAPQALEAGLVDGLCDMDGAVQAAREAAGLGDRAIVLVRYGRPVDYRPNYYAQAPGVPAQVNLVHVELPAWLRDGPQFLYLWAPGW